MIQYVTIFRFIVSSALRQMWRLFEMCIRIPMKLAWHLGAFVLFHFSFWAGTSRSKARDGWNLTQVRPVPAFSSIYCRVSKNAFELFSARTSHLLYFAMLCLRKASLKRFPDRHVNEVAANVSCSFSVMFGYWNNNMLINWNKICCLFDFSRTCHSARTKEHYNFICHFSKNLTKAKRRMYSR